MRLTTSMTSCTHSKTTSHGFFIAQKRQSSFSSYCITRSFGRVKVVYKSSRTMNHGRPLLDSVGIRRPAMGCACVGHYRVPSASTYYDIGFVRTFSTATSVVSSSSCPLVIRAPPAVVVTSQLTHSDVPQKSEEWFELRKDKLTTSTFSTALGFWKGNRRNELWQEKVFAPEGDSFTIAAKSAMNWGVLNENAAIERYKSITGRDVSLLGFATHSEEKFQWIGASPDGLIGDHPDGGVLEVKCPYNKGKPELALPWSTAPFYYMPQVQGQMEILDREWVDLYCWTPNGSTIFRICRERGYWDLINGILREFWWDNVVPAKELMLVGREMDARLYKPTSTHKQTGLAIVKSMHLAAQAKLLCREIAGHVEFFS